MAERTWSPQQQDIFTWFKTGPQNLVVRARAGTGKTTTILEAINYAPEQRILLAAFNKRIAEELTTKLRNPRAEAKTLHSVGFRFVREQWPGVKVDGDRGFRLAKQGWAMWVKTVKKDTRPLEVIQENAPRDHNPLFALIARLASIGKNVGVHTAAGLEDVAYEYNTVPENGLSDTYTVANVAQCAAEAILLAKDRDGSIDFDDMIFLPLVHGWLRPVYQLTVVDEAQDMNSTQLSMAMQITRGRIAVVGDDRQAIYGFRGADSNAIDRLKTELQAGELPLTITYRCPQAVVAEAAKLVPDYTAAPEAPAGTLRKSTEDKMMDEAAAGDFILSRINAPLARVCLGLLRAGKAARIEGRDIAKTLITLIRKQRTDSIPECLGRLQVWADRETAKLTATGKPSAQARIDFIQDQVETLTALSDGLADVPELITRIETMFADAAASQAVIVCSSVHRAKGLEANRVFILAETLYCGGRRLEEPEEANIHYVALTRAKDTLVIVGDIKPAPEGRDRRGAR